jgi:hypothetical protein
MLHHVPPQSLPSVTRAADGIVCRYAGEYPQRQLVLFLTARAGGEVCHHNGRCSQSTGMEWSWQWVRILRPVGYIPVTHADAGGKRNKIVSWRSSTQPEPPKRSGCSARAGECLLSSTGRSDLPRSCPHSVDMSILTNQARPRLSSAFGNTGSRPCVTLGMGSGTRSRLANISEVT